MTGGNDRKQSRLPRLLGALRARDWTGIGIEIAIVTIGVLLAFQVQQWGEARQRAKEERQFLERLYFEYQRGVDELRRVNRTHEQVMRDFRSAFAARDNPAQLKRYSQQVSFGCGGGYIRTTPFNDTIFTELLSSGRLDVVADPRLRDQIRDLAGAQASMKDRAVLSVEAARERAPLLHPYYRYELGADGKTLCYVGWPELVADPPALSGAAFVYRMHEFIYDGRRTLAADIARVRGEIGCALGKEACRREDKIE